MLRQIPLLLLSALFAPLCLTAQEYLSGSRADAQLSGAEWLQQEAYTTVPTFIRYQSEKQIPIERFPSYTQSAFKLSDEMGWQAIRTESDELGYIHHRFAQTYNGYPIEGAVYLVHSQNGYIRMMNGDAFANLQANTQINLSESQALQTALNHIGAEQYFWEQSGVSQHAHEWEELAAKPKGELLIVAVGGDFTKSSDFRLAYKFDVYASKPLSRNYIYVDAQTGEIIHEANRIHTADTPGTAVTKYSGTRNIVTDSYNGSYRLRESGLGGGIRTVNLQTGTNLNTWVDFTDTDNNWNNVNAQKDEAATDAHWAAEETYKFFKSHFNRDGIDGNNDMVRCFMHYDVNYFNAFWDGQNMVIGDGNSSNANKPLSAIDIIGHEMVHGITQHTADLVYQGESGALNESFSDIFGTTIELEVKPGASWNMGSDIGVVIRSMSNPKQYQDPNTYGGQYWVNPQSTNDNGGVHTNSGVQNYWYYLLAQGGSGTNDNSNAYNITGLGLNKARDIAYRTLSVYLTANSQYADARTASIQAATDLYGACTNEVQVVTNAWYAVGVGAQFSPVVTADFSTPTVLGCQVPFVVQFSNSSVNGGTFSWNFGDGGTSTQANPSHTYTSFGVYNVSLFADGGSCGTDTEVKNAYVDVQATNPCIVVMTNSTTNVTQTTCSGTLFDTGGTGNYQDNTNAIITIAPTGASSVTLNFVSFNFETDYDYLYIYDGPNINSPLIGQFDGATLPNGGTITSTTGAITLRQTTDEGLSMSGFQLTWQCVVPNAPPAVEFKAQSTTTCDGEIIFIDQSNPTPQSWLWDFGDGNTSTQQNPTHTYAANGNYTVKLTSTNSFGSNNKTKNAYISVNMPNVPSVTPSNPTIITGQTVSFNATANGNVNWYNASQNPIATGNTYTTPALTASTTYYVQNQVAATPVNGGPAANTIGAGGNFNNPVRHLKFNVAQPCTLQTVKCYASGAGNRTIEHRDASGTVLNTQSVNLVDGMNVVQLDFPLTPGTNFELGVNPSIQNPNLYRNSAGAVFPYNIGSYASITGTDAGSPGYYYFFYDWKIVGEDCASPLLPINVTVQENGIVSELPNGSLSLYPNPGKGVFKVEIDNQHTEEIQIQVFNTLGQCVYTSEPALAAQYQTEIRLSQAPSGTYLVMCKAGEFRVYKKYVVE